MSADIELQWQEKFNQLCYEVFYCNDKGKMLLRHLEAKFFRGPVAYPNQEPSWAYFNEGKNEMIRSISVGIQRHMNQQGAPANNSKRK